MKNVINLKIVFLFLAIFSAFNVFSQKNDSLSILWIGNSYTYTNDLPKMVQKIAATNAVKLSYESFTPGGAAMSDHIKNKALMPLIDKGNWDYVVIQEQSANPAKPTQLVATDVYPFAKELVHMIKAKSPKAQIIFYMTWGHKSGNQEGVSNYPLDDTYEGMQERVKTTYLEMAYQNNAWCAPVGMAWKKVRSERPYLVLYNQDQSHPSFIGSYLAANVIFSTIYQREYQTDFKGEIPEEIAEYLQQTAQNEVLKNFKLLNLN